MDLHISLDPSFPPQLAFAGGAHTFLSRTNISIITGYDIYRHTSLIFCYHPHLDDILPHCRFIRCIVPAFHCTLDPLPFRLVDHIAFLVVMLLYPHTTLQWTSSHIH